MGKSTSTVGHTSIWRGSAQWASKSRANCNRDQTDHQETEQWAISYANQIWI